MRTWQYVYLSCVRERPSCFRFGIQKFRNYLRRGTCICFLAGLAIDAKGLQRICSSRLSKTLWHGIRFVCLCLCGAIDAKALGGYAQAGVPEKVRFLSYAPYATSLPRFSSYCSRTGTVVVMHLLPPLSLHWCDGNMQPASQRSITARKQDACRNFGRLGSGVPCPKS